jgi:hypothetical protein
MRVVSDHCQQREQRGAPQGRRRVLCDARTNSEERDYTRGNAKRRRRSSGIPRLLGTTRQVIVRLRRVCSGLLFGLLGH